MTNVNRIDSIGWTGFMTVNVGRIGFYLSAEAMANLYSVVVGTTYVTGEQYVGINYNEHSYQTERPYITYGSGVIMAGATEQTRTADQHGDYFYLTNIAYVATGIEADLVFSRYITTSSTYRYAGFYAGCQFYVDFTFNYFA